MLLLTGCGGKTDDPGITRIRGEDDFITTPAPGWEVKILSGRPDEAGSLSPRYSQDQG